MSYSATLDRKHIDAFRRTWPCHGLPETLNKLWFEFTDNGDLLGYTAWSRNGRQIVLPGSVDGRVLLVLSNDAQRLIHPEHADLRY